MRDQFKRPGQFIRKYLIDHGEASVSEMHQAFKEHVNLRNVAHAKGDKLRKPTYASFYAYFRHFVKLELVERIGETPAIDFMGPAEDMGFAYKSMGKWKVRSGAIKRIWKLTIKGEMEIDAWDDPIRALGYRAH